LTVRFSRIITKKGASKMAPGHFLARLFNVVTLTMTFAALLAVSSPATDNPALPEIEGFRSGNATATILETPSGNQGTWIQQSYFRTSDNHSVDLNILRGPGTGWPGLPGEDISSTDGPIGSGAVYITLRVSGFPAAMEIHPLTGRALTITPSGEETLTFETSFEDIDLVGFAEIFLGLCQIRSNP
jgi:hypothetical protein